MGMNLVDSLSQSIRITLLDRMCLEGQPLAFEFLKEYLRLYLLEFLYLEQCRILDPNDMPLHIRRNHLMPAKRSQEFRFSKIGLPLLNQPLLRVFRFPPSVLKKKTIVVQDELFQRYLGQRHGNLELLKQLLLSILDVQEGLECFSLVDRHHLNLVQRPQN